MNNKRNTIKIIGTTGIITAALPSSWVEPVIRCVVLPAHAQTSIGLIIPEVIVNCGDESFVSEILYRFSENDGVVSFITIDDTSKLDDGGDVRIRSRVEIDRIEIVVEGDENFFRTEVLCGQNTSPSSFSRSIDLTTGIRQSSFKLDVFFNFTLTNTDDSIRLHDITVGSQ